MKILVIKGCSPPGALRQVLLISARRRAIRDPSGRASPLPRTLPVPGEKGK